MAEHSLKDVLDAIARMQGDLSRLDGKVDAYRSEAKSDFAALDAKLTTVEREVTDIKRDVAAHRRETKDGFVSLEAELEKHADPLHRELEKKLEKLAKEVAALKARPRPGARPARRR